MTAATRAARCWVVVASRDHVRAAVAGGFMQANHGHAAPLRRTRPGDGVVLSFLRDPRRWGAPFRFGFSEIPPADYARIAAALRVAPPA